MAKFLGRDEDYQLIQRREPRPWPRLRTGAGSIEGLPEVMASFRGDFTWLLCDPGLYQAGHAQKALSLIQKKVPKVVLIMDVQENPDSLSVRLLADRLLRDSPDSLVVMGGGSALDTAKAANLLAFSGGQMSEYRGYGKARGKMLPMVGIPTTTGTGSESQSYAVIEDRQTHMKMACGDPQLLFHTVILDPELVISQPRKVAALSGLDAISHALESYVTLTASPLSSEYSREAWKLLSASFERMLNDPGSLRVMAAMQWGAFLAGAAIEQSMLGACHAAANPLAAHYGLTHGVAISLMLPTVLRFNGSVVRSSYQELAIIAGLSKDDPAEALASQVEDWVSMAGLPRRLRDCGVSAGIFPILAEEAAEQWTGHFNPRLTNEFEFKRLYQSAY